MSMYVVAVLCSFLGPLFLWLYLILSAFGLASEFETQSEAGERMVFETHSKYLKGLF